MAAPVALAEQYLAGTNSTFTIGSAPNQASLAVQDGTWTVEYQVDEMTNSTSGGAYEDVPTIKKASGNAKLAYKTANLPQIAVGSVYPIVIATPSGPSLTCNARFTQVSSPQLNVKAGLVFNVTFTSQGSPITVTGLS
jgi:hypothetical protein